MIPHQTLFQHEPSNLKSSLHKTWQTLLLFLKPLQIHNLKRKKWGDMAYYTPHLKKWGDASHVSPTKLRPCNQSWLRSRLQTTLAQIGQIAPKWIYTVLKIFSPFTIFEQLALALKKQSCPEIFHCIKYIFYHSGFLINFVLALKNRVALEFITVLNILFTFRSFEQLALFFREGSLNLLYWIYIFYYSGVLSNLRLPWKTEGALEFFTVLKILLTFRIFEQLACARPEKQRVPWYFSLYWTCIFYHSGFLNN